MERRMVRGLITGLMDLNTLVNGKTTRSMGRFGFDVKIRGSTLGMTGEHMKESGVITICMGMEYTDGKTVESMKEITI
jgi:hypothetical protein